MDAPGGGEKVIMAAGLPDYFRGVDIALQALSEVIVRPKYGGIQSVSGHGTVGANIETLLAEVSGRGMLYGGFLRLEYTSSQKNGAFYLYVDGEWPGLASFEELNKFGITVEHSYPVYIRKYDDTSFIYCVAVSHGITFESSFKLTYVEADSTTPEIWYRVIYALI